MEATIQTIEQAISSHKLWLERLTNVVHGAGTIPSAQEAGDDEKCHFGQWLLGPESRKRLPTYLYDSIAMHHKLFHIHARNLVTRAASGRPLTEIRSELDELRHISRLLVSLLQNALQITQK